VTVAVIAVLAKRATASRAVAVLAVAVAEGGAGSCRSLGISRGPSGLVCTACAAVDRDG
jgi:hypothetical protein